MPRTSQPPLDDAAHDREAGSRDSTLDTTRIDDVRIGAVRPLITPALLQERVPVRGDTLALVEGSRAAIAAILHGRDDRLVVVVGPCSIHDHDEAIEYGQRLKAIAAELQDDLFVVMRAYFEKPRTTVGWKGYIGQIRRRRPRIRPGQFARRDRDVARVARPPRGGA